MKPAEIKSRLQNSILMAGGAAIVSFPLYYYNFGRLVGRIADADPTPGQVFSLAVGQAIIIFLTSFLCALVGFLYYERLSLPGPGKARDARRWLPLGLAAGLILAPAIYFLGERSAMAKVPGLFPSDPVWSLALVVGSSVTDEVVARFGLVTIMVYLLRWRGMKGHPWPASLAVSLFGALSSFLFLTRLNIDVDLTYLELAATMAFKVLVNYILCEVYLRKGLVASLCLHLGLQVRLVAYALLL